MIFFLAFIVPLIAIGIVGWLLYLLHERVEKLAKRIAVIVEWCDTLRENEETIMNDVKRLHHEFQTFQKDSERRR